jgi:hypothetical protein
MLQAGKATATTLTAPTKALRAIINDVISASKILRPLRDHSIVAAPHRPAAAILRSIASQLSCHCLR